MLTTVDLWGVCMREREILPVWATGVAAAVVAASDQL